MRNVFILLILVMIAGGLWFVSDERNRYFVRGETYLGTNQDFLGIQLGANVQIARERLEASGFRESTINLPKLNSCGGRPLAEGDTLIRFEDGTWRRGRVCVVAREQVVMALNISYGMFVT